jgi:class 3 adenylate cyclase
LTGSIRIGELAVTEIESRPRNRALVASFLFTDLVGYSKGTAADQYAAKDTLSQILGKNLAALRKEDYRVKDTGDGALIAFLVNPEHALYMALAMAEDFERAAQSAGFPSNSLRTGLHIGAVKEAIDLEARPNFVGDGINAAKRIMDFAAPGQITASRAYFEAVSWLDSAYAALFRHLGASDDKHGRAHELYAVSPNAAVLEKLRQDLAPTSRERAPLPEARVEPPASETGSSTPGAPADSPTAQQRVAGGARKWLVPVGALIVVAVLAGIFLRNGAPDQASVTVRPPATEANPPTHQAAVPSVTPPMETAPATTPPPSPAATSPTPSSALPKPDVAATGGTSRDAAGATTPAVAHPPATASATLPSAGLDPRRKPAEAAPASAIAPTPSGQGSARCQRIMEKATLGESLSQDEKRELANSCR